MNTVYGISVFSQYANTPTADGDGLKGRPIISMEELDAIVDGHLGREQWHLDYDAMRERRLSDKNGLNVATHGDMW